MSRVDLLHPLNHEFVTDRLNKTRLNQILILMSFRVAIAVPAKVGHGF